jgi:hypothetical protein
VAVAVAVMRQSKETAEMLSSVITHKDTWRSIYCRFKVNFCSVSEQESSVKVTRLLLTLSTRDN